MPPTTPTPALDDDPFGDEILTDPYPFHRQLRDAGPVVHLERYGVWAMGRYEQVHAALIDHDTFCSGRGAGLADFHREKPWRPPSLLLEADPPDHTAVRTAMSAVVSPRTVRRLRTGFAETAATIADKLAARQEFDIVTDLAEVYPLQVFPDIVGLPKQGRENLLPYGALAFNAFGPRNARTEKALAEAAPVQRWIWDSCQRHALAPDGLGASIWAAADAGQITQEQAPMLVRSLLSAGVDTTVHGIANTMHALTHHPEQWAALRDNPALAKFAFDEALRHSGPVQTFFRTTTRDVTIEDTTIPAGHKVLLFLGAANRDPRRWGTDADRFDITRKAAGHVAFGMGIHQCIGQPIARLEVESVLTALTTRLSRLEPSAPPTPKLNNTLTGWAHIPVLGHRT
ncbi:cytochrome P450 (plasmid) [Pseudonocardia sp. EC080610-09]|uniref:cytochrome P450 n=1 Tax=unclassified Pseudonocardia TaxID=2619320 RepID=UPI0007067D5E|nr:MULTISPECIES: cytochrome P450 [unclassified Pseudonocardia]ALL79574.1 cytochrome P450 [Pseudonocardia sp. EC080610-09]ALL85472.1 cytochrome P450 [Pseudonocardia sp. EC080619-01]